MDAVVFNIINIAHAVTGSADLTKAERMRRQSQTRGNGEHVGRARGTELAPARLHPVRLRAASASLTLLRDRQDERAAAKRRRMAETEGESLNTLFETLAGWEAQLKALEADIPKHLEGPSP